LITLKLTPYILLLSINTDIEVIIIITSTVKVILAIVIAVIIVLRTTANKQEMFVTKDRASTGKLLNLAWQEVKQDRTLLSSLEKLLSINREIQVIIIDWFTDHLFFIIISLIVSRLPINWLSPKIRAFWVLEIELIGG